MNVSFYKPESLENPLLDKIIREITELPIVKIKIGNKIRNFNYAGVLSEENWEDEHYQILNQQIGGNAPNTIVVFVDTIPGVYFPILK